jgi:hypothetical protein
LLKPATLFEWSTTKIGSLIMLTVFFKAMGIIFKNLYLNVAMENSKRDIEKLIGVISIPLGKIIRPRTRFTMVRILDRKGMVASNAKSITCFLISSICLIEYLSRITVPQMTYM